MRPSLCARLAPAMLALLLVTMLLGLLVPVYTDEVAWRFQLSRFFQDGMRDLGTGETCGLNTAARPPLIMLPVRAFSSGLTWLVDSPAYVRLAGVGFAVAALLLMRVLIRRVTPERERAVTGELLGFALLGIGVLPFLLVWSRPEQPVLLALLAALVIAFAPRPPHGGREPLMRVGGITALALVALSYHVKALFYLPVFLLCLWSAGAGPSRPTIRLVATALLIAAAWSAFGYWSDRFACDGDPLLAAKIRSENISALLVGGDWRTIVGALPQIMWQGLPLGYVASAQPADAYMSAWLPSATLPAPLLSAWGSAGTLAWYVALTLLAGVIVLALADRQRNWRPFLASIALAGCATAWAMTQINKNPYEAALYLPVMAVALMLALASRHRQPSWLSRLAIGLAAVSVLSQLLLIGHYLPKLWQRSTGGGYIASQPFSMAPYRYPRAEIVAAGAKCGIRPGMPRVLIDVFTYFTYRHGWRPMHRMGVLTGWNGSLSDPLAWMRARGSPGAVTACAYLPPDMRRIAIQSGDICCVRTP